MRSAPDSTPGSFKAQAHVQGHASGLSTLKPERLQAAVAKLNKQNCQSQNQSQSQDSQQAFLNVSSAMLFTRIQEAFDGARITCFSESFDHCLKFLRGKQLLIDNGHGTLCDVLSGVMENSCYVSKEVDNSENEDGASESDDQPEADTEENENQSVQVEEYRVVSRSLNGSIKGQSDQSARPLPQGDLKALYVS